MATPLQERIITLERELAETREQLRYLSSSLLNQDSDPLSLRSDEYRRYGRQMILDGFGLPSQLKLKSASVLVVGAGGLGCPALQYLSAAGIGTLGIVDHDVVEMSNLQRQILHTDERMGWMKAMSAKTAIEQINPSVKTITYTTIFDNTNAVSIMSAYDLVLDCTDNPSTRYLISDCSRALGIPLVSGAAMRYDGQLCTYNYGDSGPCYRCVFPTPPKPGNVGTCEDVGVLGVVTGVVGTLQAMEAIKLLTELNSVSQTPSMLLFSALSASPFRTVRLRSKRPTCPTCSVRPEALKKQIGFTDYVAFCGGNGENARISGERDGAMRMTPEALRRIRETSLRGGSEEPLHVLVDVRPRVEFGICHLSQSINVPLAELLLDPKQVLDSLLLSHSSPTSGHLLPAQPIDLVLICRQGNDSQIAASALLPATRNSDQIETSRKVIIRDVRGGLYGWHRHVDPHFPIY